MNQLLATVNDIVTTPFLTRALIAMLIAAPLLALAGCMVVHANLAFFSEAVGHSALTGVAIGTVLGFTDQSLALLITAGIFAVLVAVLKHVSTLSVDSIISLSMSFCVALGVAVLSRGGGFSSHSHILIGDVLTVTDRQLWNAGIIAVLALFSLALLWNGLTLISLDISVARSRGVRVVAHDVLLSIILAVIVMQCVPWVGLLVVNSLLILPAATSRNITGSMQGYVWGSIALAILSALVGVFLSVYLDTATGATVVLVALCFFLLSLFARNRA